jgi:hypothetical protein
MCCITRSQSVYWHFVSKPFNVCLFFLGFSKLVVYYVMLLFYLLVTESFHIYSVSKVVASSVVTFRCIRLCLAAVGVVQVKVSGAIDLLGSGEPKC